MVVFPDTHRAWAFFLETLYTVRFLEPDLIHYPDFTGLVGETIRHFVFLSNLCVLYFR